MEYTISLGQNGIEDYALKCETEKEAIEEVREMVENDGKNLSGNVYISWFRESDGQQGFLNPNGNHEIIGKDWNN